jgi:hypothetical protein
LGSITIALSRSGSRSTVVFTGVVLGPMASSAARETSWDQKRVTGIAEKLVEAVDKLYRDEFQAPGESYLPPLGSNDYYHRFMDTLRRLQHETRHLASALEKGAGREATKGSVDHIGELNRDLVESGKKMAFVHPELVDLASYDDLLGQLAPYYGLDQTQEKKAR